VKPVSAVLAVTYRCNSRCRTCDIWKREPGPELGPEQFRRLPEGLKNINISGGEPFLRGDLPEIVAVLREKYPRASIVISTNGLAPERIEQSVRQIGVVGVRVSIDALGELDDEVRGVKGSVDLAIDTVDRLVALGVRDLGISATISHDTAHSLRSLKQIADDRGIEFVTGLVHSSPIYFGHHEQQLPAGPELEQELTWLREKEMSSRRVKDWFRAYFTEGIIDQLRGRKRRMECRAGRYFFFMEPNGDVYPCNMWPQKMGNILEKSFEEMTAGSRGLLTEVDCCKVNCWMSCTVAPAMRKRPMVPALWVAAQKLKLRRRPAG
jgi:MoaA/NifB/PqqE/SkfB family radical SAM enzyme